MMINIKCKRSGLAGKALILPPTTGLIIEAHHENDGLRFPGAFHFNGLLDKLNLVSNKKHE
jgi:hypothetical protein